MQQMQAKLQELTQDRQGKQIDHQIKAQELQLKERETDIKAYDAETKRLTATAAAFDPAQVQQIVLSTINDIVNTPLAEPPGNESSEYQEPNGSFFTPNENEGMVNGTPQAPDM